MIKKKIRNIEKITFNISAETKQKFEVLDKKIVALGYEVDPEIVMSVILSGMEKIVTKIENDDSLQKKKND
ncbi:MAG: hypothetical protein ACYCT9_00470 [Leptospirillum sp.]